MRLKLVVTFNTNNTLGEKALKTLLMLKSYIHI